jgi:hypothetical protein
MVARSIGTCKRRKTAITAIGSVAARIAPSSSAGTNGIWCVSARPAPTIPAVTRTPGTARIATISQRRRRVAASMFQAASKIRAGRKMNSSAGANSFDDVMSIGVATISNATTYGTPMRSAMTLTISATARSATIALT